MLPTDTVYGLGADAFSPEAVNLLLATKGRGRNMPPPVLVGTVRAASALVEDLGSYGQLLIDEFWPGGLTIVCRSARTLSWDLGDTRGTVAIRMPQDPVALDLLAETGPMAVSSANLTGKPAATTAEQAREQLGDAVAIYLDGGPCDGRHRLDDRGPDRRRAPDAAPGRHLDRPAARGSHAVRGPGCHGRVPTISRETLPGRRRWGPPRVPWWVL